MQKFLIAIKSNLSIFPFIDPAFTVKFRSSLPNPRFRAFFPGFLKSSYSFTFCRFILLWDLGQGILVLFLLEVWFFFVCLFSGLQVSSCCSSMICWKGCISFFPSLNCFCTSVKNQLCMFVECVYMWRLLLGFLFCFIDLCVYSPANTMPSWLP